MHADFYHLTQTPIERVLPRLCERVLEEGKRVLLVAGEPLLGSLDALLWSYAPDAFLPHARAGDPRAAAQPILLAETADAANGADQLMIADGRWREEATGFARCFYLYDAAHLEDARSAWRALKGRDDVQARYWKQADGGKWVQGP